MRLTTGNPEEPPFGTARFLCCNTGGFAVYAKALGGAEEVVGVDLDEQVVELAKQNANLNQARVRFVQADLFAWLREVLPSGQRFDVVVLDPAKQTRDREEIDYALKRYFDMNKLALQAVAPGGLFLTCSCTGLVSEETFLETVRRGLAGRPDRAGATTHRRGAGPSVSGSRARGALSQGGVVPGGVSGTNQVIWSELSKSSRFSRIGPYCR